MKKIFNLLLLSTLSIATFAQSSYISGYPAGGLKLTGSLSSTLQRVKDKAGNNSILSISTQRIALGTATGTGLINLPDSTNAANGIQFGTGTANLYRIASTTLKTDGNFNIVGSIISPTTGILTLAQSTTLQGNTLTGSQTTPALNIAQTANTTGNFNMLNMILTNTASGPLSNFIYCGTGANPLFELNKDGILCLYRSTISSQKLVINPNNSTIGLSIKGGGNSKPFIISSDANDLYLSNNFSTSINQTQFALKADGTILIASDASAAKSSSAILELQSTTKGIVPPKMTTAQKNAISSPTNGLLVYDITLNQMSYWNGTTWINF